MVKFDGKSVNNSLILLDFILIFSENYFVPPSYFPDYGSKISLENQPLTDS